MKSIFIAMRNKAALGMLLVFMVLSRHAGALAADKIESFDAKPLGDFNHDSHIDYDLNPAQEKFLIHVPTNYTGKEAFGLVVYMSPEQSFDEVPADWAAVLEKRRLLLVAPQQAGNVEPITRRLGLAVLSALKMEQRYKIDPHRVYAAGFSGGARMANRLAFMAGDIFHGTIQACGADYFAPLTRVLATPPPPAADLDYGVGMRDASPDEIKAASTVRFVFITGDKDFRFGDIQDIYNGGYAKDGFKTKLLIVPGMQHEPFNGASLSKALDFIETNAQSGTSRPSAPAWLARDQSQWPQILLTNDAHFEDDSEVKGFSSFLMRLGDNTVVACTAKHPMGDKFQLADFDRTVRTWVMSPRTQITKTVRLSRLALNAPAAQSSDWIIATIGPQKTPLPAEPLVARETPVQPGETIYLFAVPYGDNASQHIYKGTIDFHMSGSEFAFKIDADVATAGFSGAPIMDAYGQLAGIMFGHFDRRPGDPLVLSGNETSAILDKIVPPKSTESTVDNPVASAPAPDAKAPAAKPPAAKAPAPKPPASAAQIASDKADAALRAAQPYVDGRLYVKAREKLKAVVDTYPGTPAAEKAQAQLTELEGKE